MTNLSGSSEDHGPSPSQNGGQTPDSETIDFDSKMVSDIVNGGNFQSQGSSPMMTNGWHHYDDDSNLSFDSAGTSPVRKGSKKRKLSVDSADSGELMKRSKLARTLLEDGKHGVIDGRWVCGICGKTLSRYQSTTYHSENSLN